LATKFYCALNFLDTDANLIASLHRHEKECVMFCNQLVNRRSRRIVKSFFVLMTAGIVAFGTHAVHAQSIADGTYTITNACNGKSLGLQNGNPNPWDNAMLRDAGGSGAITWQVAAAGDGSTILRAAGTQSALQTSYAKTTSETDVDLWTYGGGASQRWLIGDGGNGTFKLALAAAPGMALDAKYGGANGEAEVWLYTENTSCAQRWNIKAAGGGGNTSDAFAMTKKIGRGINFGNILEGSPVEGSWGLSLSDELFDKAKEGDFATIRLPVRWSNYAQVSAPYTIDEAFFKRVDYAISSALSRGMNIVVNMHHYRQLCDENIDGGEPNVAAGAVDDRFVSIWGQIAQRYKNQPADRVLFELYNEPNPGKQNTATSGCSASRWNALLKRAFAEVRKTNPDRFIVIGPVMWNSADSLKDLQPPDDPRVIVTIHNYSPFWFTHQGATWVPGSNAWLGTTCCSAAQISELTAPLDTAKQWAGTRWPIWVGEFGANFRAPYDSRVRYTRIARDEFEKRGFTWAYWELAAEFGVWDPVAKVWRTELRNALTGQ
jgi:endoglucanase